MWLLARSSIIPGLARETTFFVTLPYRSGVGPRAWGFWATAGPSRWIGPRHTNFEDDSICASHRPTGYGSTAAISGRCWISTASGRCATCTLKFLANGRESNMLLPAPILGYKPPTGGSSAMTMSCAVAARKLGRRGLLQAVGLAM